MESIKREELVGREKLAAFDNEEEEVSFTTPTMSLEILIVVLLQGVHVADLGCKTRTLQTRAEICCTWCQY